MFILCCGFRGEGKLDKCFLPTEGRDADVAGGTISLIAVLHR